MKSYEIKKLNSSKYNYLIIANSCYESIAEIMESNTLPFLENGKILFDLVLITSLNDNRFIEIEVKNNKLLLGSAKKIINIDDEILQLSKNYFKNNYELIENSILTKSYRKKLLQ